MIGKRVLAIVLLTAAVSPLASCGTGDIVAVGDVRIMSVGGQINACIPQQVALSGLNFLSEHGIDVIVRFTAVTGTPFLGGTSATVEVPGTAISNTQIDFMSPPAVASVEATITVILPSGISATSLPGLAQLVGGAIGPPQAIPDGYQAIGNVLLTVDPLTGVLDNDQAGGCLPQEEKAGDGGLLTSHLTVIGSDATSAQGGDVNVNPDGSFTYNPPVGYEGPDSFNYTMTDGNDSDSTTVSILVQEMVWFIDDTAPPGGDGRFTDPFDSVFAFNNVQPPPPSDTGVDQNPQNGDYIFVYAGTGLPYDGGIQLLHDQQLYGERVGLTILGVPIVPAGSTPTLTNSGIAVGQQVGVDCIVLADRNRVTGLDVDLVSANGIAGRGTSGPTTIDIVTITNCGNSGILLLDPQGIHQIGDIANGIIPCVVIDGCGFAGIEIDAFTRSIDLDTTAAAVLSSAVHVDETEIDDCQVGITCAHVDLDVELTSIGLTTPMSQDGIDFFNYSSSPCTLTVINSNIFGLLGGVGAQGRGIYVEQAGSGLTDANITTTDITSGSPTIETFNFSGAPFPTLDLAVDSCALTRPTAGYTVMVGGFGPNSTVITTFANPFVVGTGNTNGYFFDACTFDADGDPALPYVPVAGGTWTAGTGPAPVQRVLGTASFFQEDCRGHLQIDTYDVFQTAGNASGLDIQDPVNMTVTVTTSNVDNMP